MSLPSLQDSPSLPTESLSADSPPAIAMRGVYRWFRNRLILEDLNLKVASGKVTTLLGLNGAGKTTTIRILMGLIDPTRGTCVTLGKDSKELDAATLERVGYLVEGHYVPSNMRVSDVEKFCAPYRTRWDHSRFCDIVDHFSIGAQQRVGELSRGQRAGVSIASVLAGSPDLLVLDDPSLGLDPVSRRNLNETLLDYIANDNAGNNPRTILLSTHQLDDVERIADNIAIMIRGRLWVDTSLEDFQTQVHRFAFRAQDRNLAKQTKKRITSELPGVLDVRLTSSQIIVSVVQEEEHSILGALERIAGSSAEALPSSLEECVIPYLSQEHQSSTGIQKVSGKEIQS